MMKKGKPQITQITQIFLFFLRTFSHLPIFSTSYLPSFRVSSCNFVANFLVIFMVVNYDAAPSPGVEPKPTPTSCAAYRPPSPRGHCSCFNKGANPPAPPKISIKSQQQKRQKIIGASTAKTAFQLSVLWASVKPMIVKTIP
jgi:hypothetical protein